MGCHGSRFDASAISFATKDKNQQYDEAGTIRSSGFSTSGSLSSVEDGGDLPMSTCFDLEVSADLEATGESDEDGQADKDQHSQEGIGITSEASDVASKATGSFIENLSLAELTELQPLTNGGFCLICSCVFRGQRGVLKVPRINGPQGAACDLLTEIEIYKQISAQGGHPNLTRAFGSGYHLQEGQPTPFLLLERLDGGSLAQALGRSRPIANMSKDPAHRLPMALELAEAICFLHNQVIPGGFVLHRDLKPANIGLCAKGHIKVFDLGLSVVQEERKGVTDKYEMSGMAGSKRFMAPEVCHGDPYNEKIDVYSFSIVLWEICTLKKPFAGMSVAEHYREVIVGGQRPPIDPTWPSGLSALMEACWEPDPDCRPCMEEAREVLREVISSTGVLNSTGLDMDLEE